MIPVSGNPDLFVVGMSNKVFLLDWDGKEGSDYTLTKLYEVTEELGPVGTNDAKVDHQGR